MRWKYSRHVDLFCDSQIQQIIPIDCLTDANDPEKLYCDREITHKVSSLLRHCFSYLSEREIMILKQRYFLDPPETLKEISIKLGISKERVRQIQFKSMKRLKHVILAHAGFPVQSAMSGANPYPENIRERIMH